MNDIEILQKMINESDNIVFFGGAGVSTESGIKDFRSKDGLYSMKFKYPPEYMLSVSCLYNNTSDFYEFYRDKLNCLDIKPNICHKFLVDLEKSGKLKAIVTQNIDGLHTKAGSKKVYEIHGSIYRNYCDRCGKKYGPEDVFNSKDIPKCSCKGMIRPDVVLYGEMLPDNDYMSSVQAISKADMLIVAGTSLTVYPASGLIDYFSGKYLVIINNDKTSFDKRANLVINKPLKDVFSKIKV